MAMKNTAEVVIAGRVYKISGYESPEYLHQIAVYLNDKMSELQKTDGYRKQNTDQKQLLLNMNLADDFFKSRRQAEKLSADLEKKERELYSVRHDLIEAQLALENQKKELKDLKKRLKELENARSREAAQPEGMNVPAGDGTEAAGADRADSSGSPQTQASQCRSQNPAQNQGQTQNQNPAQNQSQNQSQSQNQNQLRQIHSQGRKYHPNNK